MFNLNKKIFKAYDIRGIFPDEINEEVAYWIAKAFAIMTNAKRVVVGRDMRLGSPVLHKGFIQGLIEQGVHIDDIGLVPIDAVYFAIGKFHYDAGAMLTASHNPKEYAGIKLPDKNLTFVRGTEILDFFEANPCFEKTERAGTITKKDITDNYINHILSFVDKNKLRPLKIVVDAGNGMAGKIIPLLFKNLPFELIPLFFELDGNFPNHPSNPLEPESQIAIIKKVRSEKAALGVIMDGDADRIFFVDEKGSFIRGDATLILLAEYILKKYPGAAVAYNVICSKAVPEFIKKFGGTPLRSPVGFVNVANTMKNNGGVLGGEVSAHYSFKDNFYADSGFIALLTVLQILSESNKPFSEVVKKFETYFKADEINLKIEDIPLVLEKIKKEYADGKQDELDGITVEYPHWWFNVRPSNTEPLLRITVEGNTEYIMKEKQKELLDFIKRVSTEN